MKRLIKTTLFLFLTGSLSAQGWLGDGVNTIHSENASNALTPIAVGIGTLSPTDPFDVDGTVRVESLPTTSNTGLVLYGNGSSGQSNQLHSMAFSGSSTQVLLGNGTWGALPATLAAENGCSLDASNNVVLGNVAGGTLAKLLSDREIPLNNFNVDFTGTGTVIVGTPGAGATTALRLHVGNGALYQMTGGNFPESAVSGTDNYAYSDGAMYAIINGDPTNSITGYYQNKGGSVVFGGRDLYATTHVTSYARVTGKKEWADSSGNKHYSGYLTLDTRDSVVGLLERVRVTSWGKVGIATSTPTDMLDVNGTVRVETLPATTSLGLVLYGNGSNGQSNQLHALALPTVNPSTSVLLGNGTWGALPTGGITTTCSTPYMVPVMSGTNTAICSEIYDNGSSVGISTTSPRTYTGSGSVEGPAPTNPTLSKLDVNGLTFTNSLVVSSDARFKKNIQKVPNALATVLQLNGVSYDWNKEAYKERNFDNFKQAGFIAQDVEKVYPVAVLKDNFGYYAMNYNAMLPLLTEAIKELNGKVEENAQLKAELDNTNATVTALQNQINDLCNGGCAALKGNSDLSNQLLQNVPNPFSQLTTIGYVINTGTTAYMNINSLDGKQIKHLPLTVNGAGSVTVSSADLAPGTYTYTLVVDTKVVDTKIMVITAQD